MPVRKRTTIQEMPRRELNRGWGQLARGVPQGHPHGPSCLGPSPMNPQQTGPMSLPFIRLELTRSMSRPHTAEVMSASGRKRPLIRPIRCRYAPRCSSSGVDVLERPSLDLPVRHGGAHRGRTFQLVCLRLAARVILAQHLKHLGPAELRRPVVALGEPLS
jgi:hypothetical protein